MAPIFILVPIPFQTLPAAMAPLTVITGLGEGSRGTSAGDTPPPQERSSNLSPQCKSITLARTATPFFFRQCTGAGEDKISNGGLASRFNGTLLHPLGCPLLSPIVSPGMSVHPLKARTLVRQRLMLRDEVVKITRVSHRHSVTVKGSSSLF